MFNEFKHFDKILKFTSTENVEEEYSKTEKREVVCS